MFIAGTTVMVKHSRKNNDRRREPIEETPFGWKELRRGVACRLYYLAEGKAAIQGQSTVN